MKKYAHSILRYLIIYTLGFALFYVMNALTDVIYTALSDKMPNIFPSYNAITEKAELISLEATLSLISAILTVFILTVVAVRYDNERFEFMISETDGFYTMRDGCKIYLRNYLYADVLSAFLVPVPFFLMTLIELPESNIKAFRVIRDILGTLTSPSNAFANKLGLFGGICAAVLVSLLSRIPAGYTGLKRWRGLWLSDVDRQD